MSERPFFFLHVMKTGGSTFLWNLRKNYPDEAVYPVEELDGPLGESYRKIERLRAITPERRAELLGYTGHFPYCAVRDLVPDARILTVLRHPVDRTVSYLRQCARRHEQHKGLPLEEIYDDVFFFRWFIHNHQAKVFALGPEDEAESIMQYVEIDDARLERAKANLAGVELVGLTEEFDRFTEAASERFGWRLDRVPDSNVADDDFEAGPELIARIEEDNAADLEFYEFARTLAPGA